MFDVCCDPCDPTSHDEHIVMVKTGSDVSTLPTRRFKVRSMSRGSVAPAKFLRVSLGGTIRAFIITCSPFFPQELISDYSNSRGGATELFSNYSHGRGRGTERP